MKQLIKYLVGLIALAIYMTPSRVVAQGFIEKPESERIRYYYSDEGYYTNVIFFEIWVFGNEASYSWEVSTLRRLWTDLDPSNFSENVSDIKIGMYYSSRDTTEYYAGDINFTDGSSFLNTNFKVYKKATKFTVSGNVRTDNLKDGDILSTKVKLDISRDGWPAQIYEPEPQYLIYKKRFTGDVQDVDKPTVTIYPNPFVDQINVDLPKEENITITNSIGQIVYTGISGKIDASSFPKDVYTISTSKGICKVVKLH